MAAHRQGSREQARAYFDRALHWLESKKQQKTLPTNWLRDLAAFQAEAEAVLRGFAGELPEDVFAPPR